MRFELILALAVAGCSFAQPRSPADTGAPQVTVTHSGSKWTLAGRKNSVELDATSLAVVVHAGPVTWKMMPSSPDDMVVSSGGGEIHVRLADAGQLDTKPYETGFKTGVKLVLDKFRDADVRLVLTMCLEGGDEDLVLEAMANERSAAVKELHWPPAVDGREVDYTVISSDNGTLLPRNWPKPYHPIIRSANEHSVIQSHLIESWSMSWWGFLQGESAMMVIVETPDDAAYTFNHPAGGPTSMGPSWRAQLAHFGYLRRLRVKFLPKGNYVDLAKRYRQYAIDRGWFVSLKDKMAARPIVANLIGTPFVGASVLRNKKPGSANYDAKNPQSNRRLTTFAQNIDRLRDFKARGFRNLNVSVSGWLNQGYDRQTPDALPPPPEAGGWQGMKALFDACQELGYTCWLHDQYRDYYLDAPSWNKDFAVHEGTAAGTPTAFPGTRFKHDWKDGPIPLMDNWDGGAQGYLNNDFMLGHMVKNYGAMFEHGIHPQGSYQDVFGYIPPDQDFNPDHPATRTDSMNARAAVFRWVAHHLGIVGTEAGSDWVVPYVDYTTSRFNRGSNTGTDPDHQDAIPVPLYELVYHDAVVTASSPNNLRAFLDGNAPQMGYGRTDANLDDARRLAALHKRVGLLEMTGHEFLDPGRRRERTTFADGTTVTVDWQTNTVEIKPDVK
ncbi:MAG TPA: DUF5696 domain-containing protein [Bryobacteraceae bacterium]|nr:DUF5696 domain-containing protein [Bryobacteraceae bacterium]